MSKPAVRCYCGFAPHVEHQVGGFAERAASVNCFNCGVSVGAGAAFVVDAAIRRWNAFQAKLKAAGVI